MLRVSAKTDYALRALVELARAYPAQVKADTLAREHELPRRFLETTLGELRVAGLVKTKRGADGGYWLAKPPEQITVAAVTVALEGALLDSRAVPTIDDGPVPGAIAAVWRAALAALADVLERVTLADLLARDVPV